MPMLKSSISGRGRPSRVMSWDNEHDMALSTPTTRLLLDDDITQSTTAVPDYVQLSSDSRQRIRAELFSSHDLKPRRAKTQISSNTVARLSTAAINVPDDTANIDVQAAIAILTELKKTATTEELVALHRALLPVTSSTEPQATSKKSQIQPIPAYNAEMRRRRSLYRPGEATRTQSATDSPPAKSLAHKPTTGNVQPAPTTALSLISHKLGDPTERASTPSDLGRGYLGTYKIGSLRVTNGPASPMPGSCLYRTRNASDSSADTREEYFTASECSGRHSPTKVTQEEPEVAIPGTWNDGETTPTAVITEKELGLEHAAHEDNTEDLSAHFRIVRPSSIPSLVRHGTTDTVSSIYSPSEHDTSGTIVSSKDPFVGSPHYFSARETDGVRNSLYQGNPYDDLKRRWTDSVPPASHLQASVPDSEDILEHSTNQFSQITISAPLVDDGANHILRYTAHDNRQVDGARGGYWPKAETESIRDSGYGSEASANQYHEHSHNEIRVANNLDPKSGTDLHGLKNEHLRPHYTSITSSQGSTISAQSSEIPPTRPLLLESSKTSRTPHKQLLSSTSEQNLKRQSAGPSFGRSVAGGVETSPRTPKKLQKKRPLSERMNSDSLVVQRVYTVKECPQLPDNVVSAHEERMKHNPGMDSLLRTYKHVGDAGSRESLISVDTVPQIEWRFPSPPPPVEETLKSRELPEVGCGPPSPARKFFRRRLSAGRELATTSAEIKAPKNARALAGKLPYTSAKIANGDVPAQPVATSQPQGRQVRGMSSSAASAFALARSRDRLVDPNFDIALSPVSDTMEDDPFDSHSSLPIDAPPVPSLPILKRTSRVRSMEVAVSSPAAELEKLAPATSSPSPEAKGDYDTKEQTGEDSREEVVVVPTRPAMPRVTSQEYDGSILNRPRPSPRRRTTAQGVGSAWAGSPAHDGNEDHSESSSVSNLEKEVGSVSSRERNPAPSFNLSIPRKSSPLPFPPPRSPLRAPPARLPPAPPSYHSSPLATPQGGLENSQPVTKAQDFPSVESSGPFFEPVVSWRPEIKSTEIAKKFTTEQWPLSSSPPAPMPSPNHLKQSQGQSSQLPELTTQDEQRQPRNGLWQQLPQWKPQAQSQFAGQAPPRQPLSQTQLRRPELPPTSPSYYPDYSYNYEYGYSDEYDYDSNYNIGYTHDYTSSGQVQAYDPVYGHGTSYTARTSAPLSQRVPLQHLQRPQKRVPSGPRPQMQPTREYNHAAMPVQVYGIGQSSANKSGTKRVLSTTGTNMRSEDDGALLRGAR